MNADFQVLKFRDIYNRDDLTEYQCGFQIAGNTVMISYIDATHLYGMTETIAYHITNSNGIHPKQMKWIEKRYDEELNEYYHWVQFDGVVLDSEQNDWWFYKSPYTRLQKLRKKTVDKWMAINDNQYILK